MRFAIVTPELHRTGGTERVTAELVTRLAGQQDVCLFAHRWDTFGVPLCFHKVPVVPWPGLARFISFYLAASRMVDAASREHGGYTVVYSPGPNCRQAQVSSAHFCQARQAELLRSGRLQPRPTTGSGWMRLLHRRLYSSLVAQLERKFYQSPILQAVVSPAEVLKRDLVECYGVPPEKITVAHSGADTTTFHPKAREALRPSARTSLGFSENDFCFFFIGTDWVRKSLLTILEALAAVPRGTLCIVGPEDPKAYRALAEKHGVANRLRVLPRRSDVLFYYAAADAILAPSVYEPFGLIPLEAAACGVPSVITRCMGVAEVLNSKEAIILESGEDVPALARAMCLLQQDRALRERLSRAGIARARLYSWDGMCDATIEILLKTARRDRRTGLERTPFAA